MNHWGGPVTGIDLSKATPYIVVKESEKNAILYHLENKIDEKDLLNLFEFLKDREIVDIHFK